MSIRARGIVVRDMEEIVIMVAKKDPSILEAEDVEGQLLRSMKYIGRNMKIPWIRIAPTISDENDDFNLVIMPWDMFSNRKTSKQQDYMLEEMFQKPIQEDVIINLS